MSKVFSPQDWQQISDYMDGQLSNQDRQAIEELINSSEIWKTNYRSLAETRQLLRSAPKRRSPHNFTLTQSQADQLRKPRFALFSFRFASVLTTGLAVVVFLFSFLLETSTSSLPALPAALAMKKISQTESTSSSPAGPVIIWGPPGTIPQAYNGSGIVGGRGGGGGGGAEGPGVIPYGVGGGGGGGVDTFSLEAPTEKAVTEATPETFPEIPPEIVSETVPESTLEATIEAAPNLAAAPATVAEPGVAAEPAQDTAVAPDTAPAPVPPVSPEIAPQPTQLPQPTPTAASENQIARQPASDTTGLGPILGVQPTNQVSEVVPRPVEGVQQPSVLNRNPLWVASGILLLIGISSGIVAFLKSRKKPR